MYNNEIANFKIKNMVRAWLDVEIISAISFQGFSVLPVPRKKRDPGYKVGPTKVTVVTRMDTPKSHCHLRSTYMIGVL